MKQLLKKVRPTLITYYGYLIIAGVALLYWKVIEKKPLAAMGLSKEIS